MGSQTTVLLSAWGLRLQCCSVHAVSDYSASRVHTLELSQQDKANTHMVLYTLHTDPHWILGRELNIKVCISA